MAALLPLGHLPPGRIKRTKPVTSGPDHCHLFTGVLKTECDATTGKVECLCQSAGLASCFPGAATVTVSTGAAKPLAALALGEEVLAVGSDGRLRYSPVVMFSSRRPAQRAAFVRVHTDAGLNITGGPRGDAAAPCVRGCLAGCW